ncbi:hypothetical protein Tco_0655999 [Tanacetum coccineum]|uniref:Uncharacterized protein n=1 Tax=Tanacetum coccineum TaxID=301880 RepID=A0ABQ4X7J8_9ASTR
MYAHEHVQKVLKIVDMFSIPNVSHDAIMLRVFPITLMGEAKRWKDKLHAMMIVTSYILEKNLTFRGGGYDNCEGMHQTKECPLSDEGGTIKEVKYGEFGKPFPSNDGNEARYRVGVLGYYIRVENRPPFGEKKPSLEETY